MKEKCDFILKENQIYTLTAVDLGMEGEGVAKMSGIPVFVRGALPGEEFTAMITYAKKDYAFGRLISIIAPSSERRVPPCPAFGSCGGCDLQHMSDGLQASFKKNAAENPLRKALGRDADFTVAPVVCGGLRFAYRNKLQMPFGYVGKRAVLGFFEGQSHKVVPLNECMLHGAWATTLIKTVLDWANSAGVTVYDERSGKGLLRHLVARKLSTLSVTLVINGYKIPAPERLSRALSAAFPDIGIYLSENRENTNVIMTSPAVLIYGSGARETLGGVSVSIAPESFLQVNDGVRDLLYDDVLRRLSPCGTVIDAYSGAGLLTAMIAKNRADKTGSGADGNTVCGGLDGNHVGGGKVYGIEIVPEAVKDADALLRANGLSHAVENICGDAAAELPRLIKRLTEYTVTPAVSTDLRSACLQKNPPNTPKNTDCTDLSRFEKQCNDTENRVLSCSEKPANSAENRVLNADFNGSNTASDISVILDPPRKGVATEVITALLEALPKQIIYISCNPATLARDLKLLTAGGAYGITEIIPYDMFPQTKHVETLAVLVKKG